MLIITSSKLSKTKNAYETSNERILKTTYALRNEELDLYSHLLNRRNRNRGKNKFGKIIPTGSVCTCLIIMAKELGITRSSLRHGLKKLENQGLIKRESFGIGHNFKRYSIIHLIDFKKPVTKISTYKRKKLKKEKRKSPIKKVLLHAVDHSIHSSSNSYIDLKRNTVSAPQKIPETEGISEIRRRIEKEVRHEIAEKPFLKGIPESEALRIIKKRTDLEIQKTYVSVTPIKPGTGIGERKILDPPKPLPARKTQHLTAHFLTVNGIVPIQKPPPRPIGTPRLVPIIKPPIRVWNSDFISPLGEFHENVIGFGKLYNFRLDQNGDKTRWRFLSIKGVLKSQVHQIFEKYSEQCIQDVIRWFADSNICKNPKKLNLTWLLYFKNFEKVFRSFSRFNKNFPPGYLNA